MVLLNVVKQKQDIVKIMRASRGMGDMNPKKLMQKSEKKTDMYKNGGEVWNKPRPKGLGKPKHLDSSKKSKAKAMAKEAGRPYPNLVDNMRAARKK